MGKSEGGVGGHDPDLKKEKRKKRVPIFNEKF
jgi:hypothetical protein